MIASGFLAHGAKVYITARTADRCNSTARRLSEKYDAECTSIPGDISHLAGIEAIVAELAEREPALDILVNNAGNGFGAQFSRLTEEQWDANFDVNLKGPVFLVQKALPLLQAAATPQNPARVINIGSIDGIRTPSVPSWGYGPAKAGLHHVTQYLGAYLAEKHVLVNAIALGGFATPLVAKLADPKAKSFEETDWSQADASVPVGHIGREEDIAGVAIFLASRAGGYIAGTTIRCDGGRLFAAQPAADFDFIGRPRKDKAKRDE